MPTVLPPVSSQSELNNEIQQLYTATPGSYTIDFTGDILEGEVGQPAGIYAIDLPNNVTLTIDGGGFALNGAGDNGGLAVIAGKVSIEDLTIEDTVAQGGSGARSGGGGAGLGGGLFVGPSAAVTLDDVSFSADSAKGGAGGPGGGGGTGGHSSLIVPPLGAAGTDGPYGSNGLDGKLPGSSGGVGGSGGVGRSGGTGQPGGRGGAGGSGGRGHSGAFGGTGGGGGPAASGGRGGIGGDGGAGGKGGKGGPAGTSTAHLTTGARGGHGGQGGTGATGGFGGGGGSGGAGGVGGKGGKTSLFGRGGTGGTGGAGGTGGHGGTGGGGGGGGKGGKGGTGGTSSAGLSQGAAGSGGAGGRGGSGGFGGGGGGGGLGGSVGVGSGSRPGGGVPRQGASGAGAKGGFGAGSGADNGGAGGGGLGAGGDIFVAAGGTLTVDGGLLTGGAVAGGASASDDGSAYGSGIFLKSNETITLAAPAGQTLAIADDIADQTGSGGRGTRAGTGALLIDGPGAVQLSGDNTFEGGITLQSGTLDLASAQAAGAGSIDFEPGHTSTLQFTAATAPSNPIDNFVQGNTIEIKNFAFTNHSYTGSMLTVDEPGKSIRLDVPGRTASQFQFTITDDNTFITSDAPCYREGTRIAAEHGEVPVETLAVDDRVRTWDGSFRSIVWIGRRPIDCRRHKEPRLVWPVRILAGAVSDGVPRRDLFLSPDHAILADDVLIPVKHLINHATVEQVPLDEVIYYHIELARHDVLLAEGLLAESYLDTGNRHQFANADAVSLYPEFVVPKSWPRDAAAPLATEEARVKPVWERLAARSRALGLSVPEPEFTDDPALRLQIGGRVLQPMHVQDARYMFSLPHHRGSARLLSRAGRPSDRRPWADDWRRLGVYVGRIVAHDRDGPADVPVDHPSLRDGWWAVERAGPLMRRWTDGGAALTLSPEATLLEIHLAGTIPYRTDIADMREARVA